MGERFGLLLAFAICFFFLLFFGHTLYCDNIQYLDVIWKALHMKSCTNNGNAWTWTIRKQNIYRNSQQWMIVYYSWNGGVQWSVCQVNQFGRALGTWAWSFSNMRNLMSDEGQWSRGEDGWLLFVNKFKETRTGRKWNVFFIYYAMKADQLTFDRRNCSKKRKYQKIFQSINEPFSRFASKHF